MDDKNLNINNAEQEGSYVQNTPASLLRGHWRTVALLLTIYDVIAVNLAYFLALWLRFDCMFSQIRPDSLAAWKTFVPFYTVFCLIIFWSLKLYRSLWKYASYSELMHLIIATCITGVFHSVGITFVLQKLSLNYFTRMPISYYLVGITLQFIFMAAVRFSYRFYILLSNQRKEDDEKGRVMVIGAGNAGQSLIVDIKRSKELNDKALSRYDTYTVGESYIPDEEHAHRYIHEESGELDSIFDFEHLTSDNAFGMKMIPKPFNLKQFKRGLLDPQLKYHGTGWNTLVLENHDQARSVSRFGINTKKFRYEAATFLAMITFLGWGTPFIYQGEEIGMTNTDFKSRDEMKDPVSHFIFDMTKGLHLPEPVSFRLMKSAVRDNARTPMQWDGSVNAGFNKGAEPWQCVNPDYVDINVEKDLAESSTAVTDPADPAFDPGKSIYRFYQKLLAVRKSEPTLLYGSTVEYYPDDRQVISYSRCHEDKRFLIVGNFSGTRADFIMPGDFELDELSIRMTNCGRTDAEVEEIMHMKPYEAILFEEIRK